jgi:hypothetical protein
MTIIAVLIFVAMPDQISIGAQRREPLKDPEYFCLGFLLRMAPVGIAIAFDEMKKASLRR